MDKKRQTMLRETSCPVPIVVVLYNAVVTTEIIA
jgi:hypothetical protein